MMVHERRWTDFVLKIDFTQSAQCNSGIFFRTHYLEPLPGKHVGFNGLEVAMDDTAATVARLVGLWDRSDGGRAKQGY